MSSSLPSTVVRPPIEPGYFLTPRRGAAGAPTSKTADSPLVARRKRASTSYGPPSSSSALAASSNTPLQPRPAPRRRQGSSAGSSQDHQHQRLPAAPTSSSDGGGEVVLLSSSFGHDFGLARRPTAPAGLAATREAEASAATGSALSPLLPSSNLLHRSQSEMTLRNKPQPEEGGGADDDEGLEHQHSGTVMSGRRLQDQGRKVPTTAHDDEDNDEIKDRLRAAQPPATSSSSTPSSSSSSHQQHMTGTDNEVLETASEGRSSAWATRLGHSKDNSVATTASTMTIPQQHHAHERSESTEVVEELQDHEHEDVNGHGHGYDGSIDSAPPSLSFSSYDTSDQASSRLAYEGNAAERYGASAAAGASWGAKFWVVIEDPKVGRRESTTM